MESISSTEQLQQCILAAIDPLSPSKNTASSLLNHMCHSSSDGGSILCVQLMKEVYEQAEVKQFTSQERQQIDSVIFYTFTTLQRALSISSNSGCIVPYQCRVDLKQIIYRYIFHLQEVEAPGRSKSNNLIPKFLRTKIGVVISLLIQVDFPERWQTAFQELIELADLEGRNDPTTTIEVIRKDIFLRTLDGFCDEVVENTSNEQNTLIKDYIRGMQCSYGAAVPVENTISRKIIEAIMMIFQSSIRSIYGPKGEQSSFLQFQKLPILSLSVLKRFISWFDLSLISNETIIMSLSACLSHAGPGDVDDDNGDGSLPSQCAAEAVSCFKEIVHKGMDDEKKVQLIIGLDLLKRIVESGVNLDTVDGTHINIVIRVAELTTSIGVELMNVWESSAFKEASSSEEIEVVSSQLNLLVAIFFKCFGYDDIDVSGAVIPLASRFVSSLKKEKDRPPKESFFTISSKIPQLLSVMYEQMKYPSDFEFDYEDEDDAEEEMYRFELRKLNQTITRINPDMSLHFLCNALSQIQTPLSSARTNQLEASLRLIYHYCEGIRPPPGTKVVLQNQMFRDVLIALHSSDIGAHPHREVLILYYDIAVRYADILREKTELLPNLLSFLSGERGLQHKHPRVRSRSCYLLLKLVKALDVTLRPFVETAIGGIQGLLSNQVLSLHPDDSLYLFETIGLLLGRTGLGDNEQRQYLLAVISPYVQHMESLVQSTDIQRDPETIGNNLAYSIASLAFLTKGFSKKISSEVQTILAETAQPCLNILRAIPTHDIVRNKTMIYLQRLIICLGENAMVIMPPFLEVLIEQCKEEELLDVAQLLHQLCFKFKANAIPVADSTLLPLLKKCYALMPGTTVEDKGDLAPHLLTEELQVKKIIYNSLYQVVVSKCTPILISPANVGSLENILRMIGDGAMTVPDPLMKRTCVKIFKELVEQWLGDDGNGNDANIMRGFQTYLLEIFIPGVITLFLQKDFNEKDAMQFRIIREMADMLNFLKSKCGVRVEQIIATTVASSGCTVDIPVAINEAKTKAEMEGAIKILLQTIKQR